MNLVSEPNIPIQSHNTKTTGVYENMICIVLKAMDDSVYALC